jgi:glycosyltransferase involved in cell wall biosynthesis
MSRVAGRIIERTLRPCARHHLLSNLLGRHPDGLRGLSEIPQPAATRTTEAFGLNLAGYLTTESGVGEAARLMAAAVKSVDLPHVLINFEVSYNLRCSDRTFTEFSTANPYGINLVHVNADQVPVFAGHQGREFFADRYNIGFWMWELEDFPEEWQDRFAWFDEIWTPSSFTSQAIAGRSPVPVSTIPLPVVPVQRVAYGRSHFSLPADRFIFLFMFDFASVFERKNPLALIEAFRRAFGPGSEVLLVLKCSNADFDPENAARLREAARHHGVRLIEGYVSREEVASLIAACDAYVSLHRSEGFGLTMAEAMSAGRVVIATGYSGNTEFMSADNSFLVRHRLVEATQQCGPYPKGTVWAEPDVEHATELMRWVVEHREAGAQVAQAGRESIRTMLGPHVIGRTVKAQLKDAWERRHGQRV